MDPLIKGLTKEQVDKSSRGMRLKPTKNCHVATQPSYWRSQDLSLKRQPNHVSIQ